MAPPNSAHGRREFFGLLAVGLASTIAGCTSGGDSSPPPAESSTAPPEWDVPEPLATGTTSGPDRVLSRGPTVGNQIVLTVDDGYDDQVVAGYVDFALRTGIHLTFSPNGLYSHAWAPHAARSSSSTTRSATTTCGR